MQVVEPPPAAAERQPPPAIQPPAPRTLVETGLPETLLIELVAKLIFLRGTARLPEVAQQLRLPVGVLEEILALMRAERIVELRHLGPTPVDASYGLTEAGRLRAGEFLRRCRYAGPAPVTLAAYVDQVQQQLVGRLRITRDALEARFGDLVLSGSLREQLGAALNSGRPIFLYGPAGSGKTYLAEAVGRMMSGVIAVPHAMMVDDEIIQVFDPKVHVAAAGGLRPPSLDGRGRSDERWVQCRRPTVVTGGELRLDMLDLQLDRVNGYYQAPLHLKANGGLFIVDDLGRQLVTPEQLMNRWIVPMDRRKDYLALSTGVSFEVPFDLVLVFATNLVPEQVADEAFLRRIGYKIHVGPVDEHDYRVILERVCIDLEVDCDEEGVKALLALHRNVERPLLACYPRDLVGMVRDHAAYQGTPAAFTPPNIVRAWHSYFTVH